MMMTVVIVMEPCCGSVLISKGLLLFSLLFFSLRPNRWMAIQWQIYWLPRSLLVVCWCFASEILPTVGIIPVVDLLNCNYSTRTYTLLPGSL
ncbi:hypothetical protein B9Z19DRAFT_1073548 [Tuber borchii]|uniref:Uncharacterized protein n=1 Tax=Tuber borchii TaxID=42251 RepID=A0A2T7A614_TUBBO|nr:hypothetical protein B9Z19DRAFT_1073548 [Tuber borchii]